MRCSAGIFGVADGIMNIDEHANWNLHLKPIVFFFLKKQVSMMLNSAEHKLLTAHKN